MIVKVTSKGPKRIDTIEDVPGFKEGARGKRCETCAWCSEDEYGEEICNKFIWKGNTDPKFYVCTDEYCDLFESKK